MVVNYPEIANFFKRKQFSEDDLNELKMELSEKYGNKKTITKSIHSSISLYLVKYNTSLSSLKNQKRKRRLKKKKKTSLRVCGVTIPKAKYSKQFSSDKIQESSKDVMNLNISDKKVPKTNKNHKLLNRLNIKFPKRTQRSVSITPGVYGVLRKSKTMRIIYTRM